MGLEFVSRHRNRFSPLQNAQKVPEALPASHSVMVRVAGENEALSHVHLAAELKTHETYG
jgi:hypothetical protein